jgi:CBS domain containing-hemolysin-like protein
MSLLTLKSVDQSSLPLPGADPWHAEPADPALTAMTDFRERASISVSQDATIDAALEHMRHTGVRCAFALDDASGAVVGLITAYDITSEKPMRHQQSALEPRSEVQVREIMQPMRDWRVADIEDVEAATCGDLLQLFDETGLTHVPVMETVGGVPRLRGLLSAARVRRLLSR